MPLDRAGTRSSGSREKQCLLRFARNGSGICGMGLAEQRSSVSCNWLACWGGRSYRNIIESKLRITGVCMTLLSDSCVQETAMVHGLSRSENLHGRAIISKAVQGNPHGPCRTTRWGWIGSTACQTSSGVSLRLLDSNA